MTLIYGKNSVEAYLEYAPNELDYIILQEGLQKKTEEYFVQLAKQAHLEIRRATRRQIEQQVGHQAVHQGIVAQAKPFQYRTLEQALQLARGKMPCFILLDQLQDPRNLGAILRTVDCCGGIDGVIITKHHSAEVTASVIKTSTGAALNIPIIQVTNARAAIQEMKKHDIWVCGLDMTGATHYRKQRYDMPLCFVIGGEDSGVRPIIKKEMDFNVFIPMQSQTVTSLNVSVATSLLLYEVAFQRATLD